MHRNPPEKLRQAHKERLDQGMKTNLDREVVDGFGDEWTRFNQGELNSEERQKIFDDYFRIFPFKALDLENAVGADLGCGSGRWAAILAPRVGYLHLVDASPEALAVAKQNTSGLLNVDSKCTSVGQLPFEESSLDFAYSLGVLHHVPDTASAINSIAKVLRPGAPFLLYLYYSFDNRPSWFRHLWKASDKIRRFVSRQPLGRRYAYSQLLAFGVYLPIAVACRFLSSLGVSTRNIPLSYYKDKSIYTLRTDALDRFGTRLEQRFSQKEIHSMLTAAGFHNITFSPTAPYWCACGIRAT